MSWFPSSSPGKSRKVRFRKASALDIRKLKREIRADEKKYGYGGTPDTISQGKFQMSDEQEKDVSDKMEHVQQATIVDKFKTYVHHMRTKDSSELLALASDLAKHIADAVEKPTWVNIGRAGINIWKTLDSSKVYAEEYFHPDWSYPFSRQFNEFIVQAISTYPYKVIKCADEDIVVKIATVYDEEVGWTYNTNDQTVGGVYIRDKRQDQGREVVKRALWDKMAFRSIVMEKMKPKQGHEYSDGINFQKDDDLVGLSSQKADEYATYLRRCMDASVSRTILFHGRPGTGKSTIAQAIADRLQLKTLRIRVEDISDFDNTVIFEAVNIFEPDAVILDDLDRAMSQSHLLETMTRFHKHVKLVFATVNHRDALDEALMRPGRFDEVCHVRSLDDIVVKKMLGDENLDMFDVVKKWPIAFIQEYVTRRKFMTKEEALSSVKELQRRVDRLAEDGEPDDDDEDEDEDKEEETDDKLGAVAADEEEKGEDEDEEDKDVDDAALAIDSAEELIEVPETVKRFLKRIKAVRPGVRLGRKMKLKGRSVGATTMSSALKEYEKKIAAGGADIKVVTLDELTEEVKDIMKDAKE